jgi:hypothetical protein
MTLNRKNTGARYSEPELEAEQDRSGLPLRNWIFFILFMSAIILVFGLLVVRTAGFREIVSVKNEEWTQTRIGIRGSHIGWPYDIVLTDVTFPAKAEGGNAALFIPEVRAGWRPRRGLQIRFVAPHVRLVQSVPGVYVPEELARIGDLRNAGDLSEWLAALDGRATLHIEQASLEVVTAAGEPVRRLDGVGLTVTPVLLPGRSGAHYRLSAGPMAGAEGTFRKLDQEWLVCGVSNVAEIAFTVDAEGKPWARDFWKGVQP